MLRRSTGLSISKVSLPVARALVGVGATIGTLICLSGSVSAQQLDVRSLQQRMDRLESDLSILQRQVYVGGGAPSGAGRPAASGPVEPTIAASFEVRISQLEERMQNLNGKLEEVGHNVDVLKSQLERLQKDIDFRLTALERGGAPAAQPGAGAQAPVAPNASTSASAGPTKPVPGAGQVLPVGTSQQQYDYARALLIQQDYASAEKAFTAFVNTHPDDALAGPAQYWLGETYYVRGDYKEAARVFAEGYQRYAKSSKAPDTLLKLGMSLVQLKRNKDACVLFHELGTKYPSAPTNVKQAVERERKRAGCG